MLLIEFFQLSGSQLGECLFEAATNAPAAFIRSGRPETGVKQVALADFKGRAAKDASACFCRLGTRRSVPQRDRGECDANTVRYLLQDSSLLRSSSPAPLMDRERLNEKIRASERIEAAYQGGASQSRVPAHINYCREVHDSRMVLVNTVSRLGDEAVALSGLQIRSHHFRDELAKCNFGAPSQLGARLARVA